MAKPKTSEQRTLESNLSYIKKVYKQMIRKRRMQGKPTGRLVERLRAVELQLWVLRLNGTNDVASNGS